MKNIRTYLIILRNIRKLIESNYIESPPPTQCPKNNLSEDYESFEKLSEFKYDIAKVPKNKFNLNFLRKTRENLLINLLKHIGRLKISFIEYPQLSSILFNYRKIKFILSLTDENSFLYNSSFDSNYYKRENPDIQQKWRHPLLLHFLIHGQYENRNTNILRVNNPLYLIKKLKSIRRASSNKNNILFLSNIPITDGVYKWRIEFQKLILESKGFSVSIENFDKPSNSFIDNILNSNTVVIVRPSNSINYIELRNFLKATQKRIILDIDDLIFDETLCYQSGSFKSGNSSLLELQKRANFYLSEIATIANVYCSTSVLQKIIKGLIPECDVQLVKNNLTRSQILKYNDQKKSSDFFNMLIVSGSFTHDFDFHEIYPELLNFLLRHPDVTLTVVGRSKLFSKIPRFLESRIKTIGYLNYDEYITLLSSYDLMIYPQDNNIFNDAKSNIKFIEAAIAKTPILASKSNEFLLSITDNYNGFLFDSDFTNKLESIYTCREILPDIGQKAYETVLSNSI